MTFISELILQAIDMLVEKRLRELLFDKTIRCLIVSIENYNEGIYKVKYMDSIFIAYSNNDKYEIDNWVYVKIPMNDFSNKKIIECLCEV